MRKSNITVFLLVYLVVHFFYWALRLGDNFTFPNGIRFLSSHTIPVFLIILLWRLKDVEYIFKNKLWHNVGYGLFTSMFFLLGFMLFAGSIFQTEFKTMFNFQWSYPALIEYYITACFFLLILARKQTGKIEASLLTGLLLFSAGVIYELPVYYRTNPHIGIYYHESHPFFINSRLIMLPLLLYYFIKNFQWKPTAHKKLLLATIPLVLFSIYYGVRGTLYSMQLLSGWVPRVPTLVYFGYALTMIQEKKGNGRKNSLLL